MAETRPARVSVVADPPAGVNVAEVIPSGRRLMAGLAYGADARAADLADDLRAAADSSPDPLVVDLRGVDWMDSGACAVFVKVWKALRARGRPLVLCVTEPIRDMFRVTGLDRLLPVVTDLDAAVAAARAPGEVRA